MKTNLLKTGLALAAVVALCAPLAAQAQVVQEIVVGQPAAVAVTVPSHQVNAGEHLLFRVINPTSAPVAFAVPELGINYPVPALSERTFFVDTSHAMDRELAYSVLGAGNNQLASGIIVNEDYWAPETSVSVAALSNIINYSTAYSAPIEPEPEYYSRPAAFPAGAEAPERQMIRGFW